MSLFDPLKPYWAAIRLAGWCLLIAGALLYGRSCGRSERAAEVARLHADHAKALARSAQATAALATAYRETERKTGQAFIAATADHSEALRRVETERDALVARLVAGTDRLQERWAGCVSATPAPAGRAGVPDGATADRAASAGRIVAAAAACDSHVLALQSILTAERASN